jgi:hypothetical protein
MHVTKIRVFFKDPTAFPPPYVGLTIKGTSLTGTTTTLYTFDENSISGWNYVNIAGYYTMIEVGGTSGCNHINEIEISGDVI